MSTTTATSLLDRVRKLIAMTASPHVEEARTAAFAACRLIREHDLHLADPTAIGPPATSGTLPSRRRPFRSKYSGLCLGCGDRYRVGDLVWWSRGNGTLCDGCNYLERAGAP